MEIITPYNIFNYLKFFEKIIDDDNLKTKIKLKLKQWNDVAHKKKQDTNVYLYQKYYY